MIRRSRKRAILGRVFSTAATLALRIGVRDTQCGAKLFRATPWIAAAFERPFCTRWIFDVELLARIHQLANRCGGPTLAECVYELPLDDWQDVAGSKLRARDFLKAPLELATIVVRYRGPLATAPPSLATLPRMVIPLEAVSGNDSARPAAEEDSSPRRAA
jgi:hypothetical protein